MTALVQAMMCPNQPGGAKMVVGGNTGNDLLGVYVFRYKNFSLLSKVDIYKLN